MWDALKIRNNLTKTIAKKIALVLFVLAITLVTVGCAPKPVESIDTPTTANTSVSPEPKPAPVPPVETKSPRELELEEFLEKAPEIPGLTKSISENKIVYNNEQGEYSGYYVEKAFLNGEQTDGVTLSATIVQSITKDNSIQKNEGYLPIPVDPSEDQVISIDFMPSIQIFANTNNFGVISVTTNKPINLTNFYLGSREIVEIRYSKEKGVNLPALVTKETSQNTILDGDYIGNIGVFLEEGNFYRLPTNPNFTSTCGDVLGEFDNQILLMKSMRDYTQKEESLYLYQTDILTIENSLIFLMANENR